MRPKVLLAGLGETGSVLCTLLSANWDVIAIDNDATAIASSPALTNPRTSIVAHSGDATSALVLKKAAVDECHAAVSCCGNDEAGYEFLRLAHDVLGIENRFALMYKLDWESRYREQNVEVISQDRSCAAISASRIQPGQHAITGLGLGQGELVAVDVLPNSSVIGRRLAELHPKRWLIGAVYRDSALIVPHGDTVLAAGDQVLLIGEPEILPSIATFIRTGESEFPLQYGSNIIALCGPQIEATLEEAAYLIENTRARKFETISCEAERSRLMALVDRCESRRIPHEFSCAAKNSLDSLVEEARQRDLGTLVLPPERLGFWSRIGLSRSRTASIIDMVDSPVLVCRQTHPYRSVLIALAELPFHTAAAQLAIDIVRMVKASLHLGVVHQPDIVEGAEYREQIERKRRDIENIASLYHVKINSHVVEGNPIYEIERLSQNYDLLVLPYPKRRRSFITRPDVGLNLIHRARCSVMVMPHD